LPTPASSWKSRKMAYAGAGSDYESSLLLPAPDVKLKADG
jgi:hypothetical protein